MAYEADFAEFWERYPRRVGKLAAKKAYDKARKNGARQDELLIGIENYIRHKPQYADFCHASTWLSAGRWMDQWDVAPTRAVRRHWFDECQELHGGTCDKQWNHEMRKRASA